MEDGAGDLAKEAALPVARADSRGPEAAGGIWPLIDRPGFLVRRLYQIHVSLFSERCAAFRVTPLQYSLLSELMVRGEADQTTLAHAVALDRTTTTGALRRLEARGFVSRTISPVDRRSQQCRLTDEGREIHAAMADAVRQAHADTIAALSPAERKLFVDLMRKIAAAHGQAAHGQAPGMAELQT
ncbi:transcriptional regulator, MarR family [Methylobacterium sp. 4-46]|uniref:MarR family winged helix-turn-helix transcriptional regulator n=1 Tax=unclassified Methylobacterium TaxID=2615210 RepID=UPI000152E127|nr:MULTISPECIES: MarR family transcriptional regulator [Methylobacterium]ACA19992.1 transcriptional regulator, MarR family [Methylobacterium sp. 4-46]WFT79176.1 MarR family transcriptional regulator [Methylobacterium nodulans]